MSSICVGLLNIYIVKNLYAGHAKCVFGQTQVEYLGHIVGGGVVAVDPAKTRAIMDWPEPTYVNTFNSFSG